MNLKPNYDMILLFNIYYLLLFNYYLDIII